MANSETDIANKALGHIGVGATVQNFRTGRTAQDRAILTVYDDAVLQVLRDAPWPFATEFVELVEITPLVNEAEWEFTYAYPTDCVMFRRIVRDPAVPETRQNRIPYRLVRGKYILSNWPEAVGEITFKETNVQRWDSDFAEAVSLLVAVLIAPKLMQSDRFKLAQRAAELYTWRVNTAKANAFNEEYPPEESRSEYERSRD